MSKIVSMKLPLHTISALAEIEVRSAIRRKQHSGEVTSDSAERAIRRLGSELGLYNAVSVTNRVLLGARHVVDKYHLRSLDAIQLASALTTAQYEPDDPLTFVSADTRLLDAAKLSGLQTLNPAQPTP